MHCRGPFEALDVCSNAESCMQEIVWFSFCPRGAEFA